MSDLIRDQVFAETMRFRSVLTSLLSRYEGRWVVFRDGEVASSHDTEEQAYIAGLDRFGPEGAHVIALVRESQVVTLGAIEVRGV